VFCIAGSPDKRAAARAEAEARREEAREDLRRAYRTLLASTLLPSRDDGAGGAGAAVPRSRKTPEKREPHT